VISQQDLVRELLRRGPAAWSVVERVQDLAFAADRPARQRRDRRTRLTLIVHQDVPRGRGTARLDIDPFDGSAPDLVDRAIALALAAVGPAWTSAPPAAPARVTLVDPALVEPELGAVALGALAHLRRPDRITVTAAIEVLREKLTVLSGSGLHATWLATDLRADALLATADHSLTVSRHARRLDDLDLDAALADAAADLALLADAGPAAPGPCALWLAPEALLPAPDRFRGADGALALALALGGDAPAAHHHGLWTLFAQQASSAVERRGLTRYRLHADIARGASQLPEPLSITSNGALDFATLSAPVTDDAVAVRSFPLIERGVAVGLALSPREAALRGTDPNGGVRNLDVSPGTWSPAPSPTIRTLELRRLHAVTIDAYTGDASLDIALALDHRPGRPSTPFTGGTVRLDLFAALARARRSSQLLRRGAYHGPAAVLIDDVELIA
jgi:predicted Zn-dependent protease